MSDVQFSMFKDFRHNPFVPEKRKGNRRKKHYVLYRAELRAEVCSSWSARWDSNPRPRRPKRSISFLRHLLYPLYIHLVDHLHGVLPFLHGHQHVEYFIRSTGDQVHTLVLAQVERRIAVTGQVEQVQFGIGRHGTAVFLPYLGDLVVAADGAAVAMGRKAVRVRRTAGSPEKSALKIGPLT